ncbi:MAG: hypothetical protein JWQ94_1711 [Tardiphaga sp.]|nr:hypothetical protein [Tardiphaga sp.]
MSPSSGSDRSRGGAPSRDGGPDEAALYIKAVIGDLSQMARRHGHDMLGYLLDMAQMEADQILRRRGKR